MSRSTLGRWIPAVGVATLALAGSPAAAWAGAFDERGVFRVSADAAAFEAFVAPTYFVPDDAEESCTLKTFHEIIDDGTALEGATYARVDAPSACQVRFVVELPPVQASYRATLWMRHGSAGARVLVSYPAESGIPLQPARMAPTGRATSDGWIELASNEFPVDGTLSPTVYLRFADFADADGVDLDAFELVPAGEFVAGEACEGVRDPVCGPERTCISGQCVLGRLSVPPLPEPPLKQAMAAALAGRIEVFYGGRKTRLEDLPVARLSLARMRSAQSAWAYWSDFGRAVRELHDWHTSASAPVGESLAVTTARLNACFVEGDADRSRGTWPSHPAYRDILVSHVGNGSAGLAPGDRLVAVDGLHPLEWARGLVDVQWGYHVATDASSFADFAEALGGPAWSGGAMLLRYAREITVVRCDAGTGTCSDVAETLRIRELPAVLGGPDVYCDNRPRYHLGDESPSEATHQVFYEIFDGPVANTTPEEAIYGMVWDTLYGGGDPNGYVNGKIRTLSAFWKQNARGVILDHRAGNGGTLDAPEYMTQLVRPPFTLAAVRMPIEIAGFEGPSTPAEGVALFEQSKAFSPYTVGADDHDPELPVALILHRDGSASDYMPLGMKGAPKVRIFGPGPTAGAFSTFVQFAYWGGLRMQLASGDTITFDGQPWIGRGVMPDQVVQQRQSDLMVGVDTLHEAALAWVRQELKQP